MVTMFSTILSIFVLCYVTLSVLSEECVAPLGVADDSIIRNDQLSASSETLHYRAEYGRLNGPSAWRPRRDSRDWIQVLFDTLVKVTKIATQGLDDGRIQDEYVTRYAVQYGNDEESWMYLRNAGDNDMVFTGNQDSGGTIVQYLPNAVLLSSLRIEIVECSIEGCALRFELYGCQVPVCEVLVSPVNGRVTSFGTDFTGSQTIECNAGFTPIGEISTVCTATGMTGNGGSATWEPDITSTTCVPVCDVLNAPMDGHVTNVMTTVFTDGDMQMIGCDDGFTPMGETSTVCTAAENGGSATWKPDITSTTCVPACGVLNAPMDGHVTDTITTVFTDGDMQIIECDDGFTAMGETSTVCIANGDVASWEPDISSTSCVIGSTPSSADRPTEKITATGSRVGIGLIVGIVIGAVSLAVIVTLVVVCYSRGSGRQTKSKGDNENVSPTVGHTYVTTIEDNGEINMEPVIYANEVQSNDQTGKMYEDVQGGALNTEDECAYANPDVTDKDQEYAYADSHRKDKEQEYAYADSGVRAKEEEYAYANSDVKDKEPEYAFADSDVKDKDPEYAYADFKPKLNPPEKISPIYANSPVSK